MRWLCLIALVACTTTKSGPGTRVVSLHDVTSEIAVALGARLVGVADPMEPPPAWAATLREVPRVDGLESILAVHPTHVLGMGVVAEQDPELVAALRARGVQVELFDPRRLEDVDAMAGRIAAISSTSPLPAIGELRAPRGDKRVFVYDCCDPPFTAGGATVLNDLVHRAGGKNLFAGVDADWTHVSWEAVVAAKPELIVVHDYVWGDQDDVPGKREQLRAHGLGDVPVLILPLPLSLGGLGSREAFTRLSTAIGAL